MSDFNIPQIINLPAFNDPSGNLAVVEEENHIPFKIERVYWIYDVPGGEIRGGHAFIKQKEFIITLCGRLVTKNVPDNTIWVQNSAL